MKTIFPFLIIVVLGNPVFSQTEKGDKYISGSVNFDFDIRNRHDPDGNELSNGKSYSLFIGPGLGFYVTKNLVAGFSTGYGYNKDKNDNDNASSSFTESSGHSIGVSGYLRYYKFFNDKFGIFGSAGIPFSYSKSTDIYISSIGVVGPYRRESVYNRYTTGISVNPGLSLFLTKRIAIESTLGSLGYFITIQKLKEESTNNTRENKDVIHSGGLTFSSSLSFSVRYFFVKADDPR